VPETYDFRLRYTRSPRDTLNCRENELRLPSSEPNHDIVLKARDSNKSIQESDSLVLHGTGWTTSDDAERLGRFYADLLARVYARLRLGADFGARAAKSWFTQEGLASVSKQTGRPALNDVHGLMVYERTCRPSLLFASLRGDMVRGVSLEQFISVFNLTLSRPREISDQERIALELFNASFFQKSVDGRFLLLMCGVEALIKQEPLSENVKRLVQTFQSQVDAASALEDEEKDALKRGLGQLQRESIRQAGRRLIGRKIGTRSYKGMPADEFFGNCYTLRSRLVHGELPFPTLNDVNPIGAQLEVMLSDLLSIDLLDDGIRGTKGSQRPETA